MVTWTTSSFLSLRSQRMTSEGRSISNCFGVAIRLSHRWLCAAANFLRWVHSVWTEKPAGALNRSTSTFIRAHVGAKRLPVKFGQQEAVVGGSTVILPGLSGVHWP